MVLRAIKLPGNCGQARSADRRLIGRINFWAGRPLYLPYLRLGDTFAVQYNSSFPCRYSSQDRQHQPACRIPGAEAITLSDRITNPIFRFDRSSAIRNGSAVVRALAIGLGHHQQVAVPQESATVHQSGHYDHW
jgi:hypothetical protein